MGFKQNNNLNKKIINSFFLLLFLFSFLFIAIKANKAKAQFGGLVFDPSVYQAISTESVREAADDVREAADDTKTSIWDKIKDRLQVAGDVAYKNALRVYVGRLAQDTATWLASAGTGQKPLFITDPNYWKDLTDAAAGDALYTLGANVFGVNMCEPNIGVKMNITFGLGRIFNPNTWCEDSCEWAYNSKISSVGEKFNEDKVEFIDDTKVPKTGILNYYQQFASDAKRDDKTSTRFDEFKKMYGDNFPCPVKCVGEETVGPPSPGMLCMEAEYEDNPDNMEKLPTTLENLRACIYTLQNISIEESQEATSDRTKCMRNCNNYEPRKAQCKASDIWTNVETMADETGGKLIGDTVDIFLKPEENDIGQLLLTYEHINEKTQAELSREKTLAEGQIKPVTATVSKSILSPLEFVHARGNLALDKGTEPAVAYTGSWYADSITIFTNTLINKLIERIFGGCGLNQAACESSPSGGSKLSQLMFGSGGPVGTAAAKLRFSSIAKVEYSRGSPGQDPINSGNLTSEGIIDSGFGTAINEKMTVKKALEEGLIGGIFGFDIEGRQPSIDSGISYRTILYLRKYRVVPVGWELAAEWIRENPQSISLKQIMNEYNNCEPGGESTCSHSEETCVNNSDCYDDSIYPTCNNSGDCTGVCSGTFCINEPSVSCTSDTDCNQVCAHETSDDTSHCYYFCNDDSDCGPSEMCVDNFGGTSGHCVSENEAYCQYQSSASPFCGLIDPNWVLKLSATYCEKSGAGNEIISRDYICADDTNSDGEANCYSGREGDYADDIGQWQIMRDSNTCIDEISCLKEDDQGKCIKYGYCFEERPIWGFNGEECPRQYASCQTFAVQSGEEYSYLTNTVDTNGCDSTNAGCQWYCQDYDQANSTWTCPSTGNKIYLDRDVAECEESDKGCQEFIRMSQGTNLENSSSFEYYEAWPAAIVPNSGEIDDGIEDEIYGVYYKNPSLNCGVEVEAVSEAHSGSVAIKLLHHNTDCTGGDTGHYLSSEGINMGSSVLNRTFTASYYAKATEPVSSIFRVKNGGWDDTLSPPANVFVHLANKNVDYTTDWRRYSVTFTVDELALKSDGSPANSDMLVLLINTSGDPTIDLFIDDLQIEEGGISSYKNYAESNKIYLNGERFSCPKEDVGCEEYSPVSGGQSIPGVVYANNLCSADEVGCQAFREKAIERIPQRPETDPLYFISGTGTQCKAEDVGCEEYTNLEKAASGGEVREYFKKIKQCVKPDSSDIVTYYTWVGDNESGYQLKSFSLKQSNLNNYDSETGSAPCTNLDISGGGVDPACRDTAPTSDYEPAVCQASEVGTNPDCAEFYDTSGNVFYRLRSRIIEATDKCVTYRNSIDNSQSLDNVYFINPEASMTCSADKAGCREYKGNTGDVTRKVFESDFEETNLAATNWTNGGISNESLNIDGHSLRVLDNSTATSVINPEVLKEAKLVEGQYYELSFWMKPNNANYINSIVIQNDAYACSSGGDCYSDSGCPTGETCDDVGESGAISFGSFPVSLTPEWNLYTFGPLRFNREALGFEQLAIAADGSFFLDNILLEEVADTDYLIKNTFVSCSAGSVGCQAYKDSKDDVHYIKSFDHLCSEEYIGCEALINTQNSASPFKETIKDIDIPADTVESIVYDNSKFCPGSSKGCQMLGSPVMDSLERIVKWEDKYLINNPDRYNYREGDQDLSIACLAEEEGCQEYTYAEGSGLMWFKDPGGKTCEYKNLFEDEEYKWYKTNTDQFCPSITPPPEGRPTGLACVNTCDSGGYAGQACVLDEDCKSWCDAASDNTGEMCQEAADCPNGSCVASNCQGDTDEVGKACTDSTDCSGDNKCDYWVGLCPRNESGCNEYRDPTDPAGCRSSCSLMEIGGEPVPFNNSCQATVCVAGGEDGEYCGSDADCPGGACSGVGISGCRSYYYIRNTIEENKGDCNGQIDLETGCRPFNDVSNPELNLRI
ncbi:MAG: hypothetical protein U5L76_05775 [Patescibacteria group bacterium]|nr:hypothetical protein [Patescibacteria group bacterium]MDZ7799075.1 hypothetical protein [Patescibacteria group bacterium]